MRLILLLLLVAIVVWISFIYLFLSEISVIGFWLVYSDNRYDTIAVLPDLRDAMQIDFY
jgi:hypothetical protein